MLHYRLKIDVRCPKHRFNPQVSENLAERKASCVPCERLVSIYNMAEKLMRTVREALADMPTKAQKELAPA